MHIIYVLCIDMVFIKNYFGVVLLELRFMLETAKRQAQPRFSLVFHPIQTSGSVDPRFRQLSLDRRSPSGAIRTIHDSNSCPSGPQDLLQQFEHAKEIIGIVSDIISLSSSASLFLTFLANRTERLILGQENPKGVIFVMDFFSPNFLSPNFMVLMKLLCYKKRRHGFHIINQIYR